MPDEESEPGLGLEPRGPLANFPLRPVLQLGGERQAGAGSPGESGLVSRGSQGLRSPLESRRGSLGAP